jgi:hypothetical protein
MSDEAMARAPAVSRKLQDRRSHPPRRAERRPWRIALRGDAAAGRLGWFPLLATTSAIGLVVIATADALSRSTTSSLQAFFWLGLIVIYAPIAYRLSTPGATRTERLSLVVLLGLSLYLVKVLLDPFGYTFADELAHAPNANAILRTHHLFQANSILPVTAYYPGLEGVTAGLAAMSGLSAFGAGLIVVGVARAIVMIALFLLFERVSGSFRVGGLAAAIYAANANFVFFSAEFSYESLALPLVVFVLLAVAEWSRAKDIMGWSVTILVTSAAVVATHHLSSYALLAALFAISVASRLIRPTRPSRPPWALFAVVAILATAWLTLVASLTVGYLTPVLDRAFLSTIHVIGGEATTRKLFSPSDTGYHAPILERAVAIGSVLLIALAFPFGLWEVWRRYRHDALAVVLTLGGAGFFGIVSLRLIPDAWETANRASEFLFVGLALPLALAGFDRWAPARARWLGPAAFTAALVVVFAGGVIAGWKPTLRLSQPYRIEAGGRTIDSEPRQMARWVAVRLGQGQRFAASDSDARLLATYANAYALTGRSGQADITDILQTPTLELWQLETLVRNNLRYVVVDRRPQAFDNSAGYYFDLRSDQSAPSAPLAAVNKFEALPSDRIYDSGRIVIFDLGEGT